MNSTRDPLQHRIGIASELATIQEVSRGDPRSYANKVTGPSLPTLFSTGSRHSAGSRSAWRLPMRGPGLQAPTRNWPGFDQMRLQIPGHLVLTHWNFYCRIRTLRSR